MPRSSPAPFFVWSEPLLWQLPWSFVAPLQRFFFLPGVALNFLTCTSIKFWTQEERKERPPSGVSSLHQTFCGILCRVIISLKSCKFGDINLIKGDSFRKMKQIGQGHTTNKWGSQVSYSGLSTAKWDSSLCNKAHLPPRQIKGFQVDRG